VHSLERISLSRSRSLSLALSLSLSLSRSLYLALSLYIYMYTCIYIHIHLHTCIFTSTLAVPPRRDSTPRLYSIIEYESSPPPPAPPPPPPPLGSRSTPRRHFFVCGTVLLCTLVAWFTHQLAVEFLGTDSEKVTHEKKEKTITHISWQWSYLGPGSENVRI